MSRSRFPSARQRGFTLIELMVGMAISLILTVVIAQVFLETRKSFAVQDDQGRMQENSRYAMQTISRVVRQAGFRSYVGVSSATYFPSSSTPAVNGIDGYAAANDETASDQITVRFQGSGASTTTADNTIFDCLGNSYAFGVMGTNTFAILPGSDGNGLFCSIVSPPPATSLPLSTDWVEVVPGIENMQILYGLDTDADRTANIFKRINNITTTTDLDQIVSVRFSLLVRSPTNTTSPVVNASTYSLNGVTIPAANDRRLRRVVNFTVNMRNRTP